MFEIGQLCKLNFPSSFPLYFFDIVKNKYINNFIQCNPDDSLVYIKNIKHNLLLLHLRSNKLTLAPKGFIKLLAQT